MIPAAFEYERVDSVDAAIAALQGDGESKLLAGGHSLLPNMKLRLAIPTKLIDIGRIRELSYVRESNGGVAIGALTRYRDLETDGALRELCPIVASVAGQVGDPQVRLRPGTRSFTAVDSHTEGMPTRVVTDGDGIEIRSMMTSTLSADHRVVDGAIAARFLKAVKDELETAAH